MFYINISNGLLNNSHRKRMGEAVWEFMWCIDKVTRVDENGVGYVLGGKPIKLSDIANGYKNSKGKFIEGLGCHENTVSRNLKRLVDEGYIAITRTPYGLVCKVWKTKKNFVDKSKKRNTISVGRSTINGDSIRSTQYGESNKTSSEDFSKTFQLRADNLIRLKGMKNKAFGSKVISNASSRV